jgi:hypothetical protein
MNTMDGGRSVASVRANAPLVADVTAPEFQAMAAPFRQFADNPQFILTEDL